MTKNQIRRRDKRKYGAIPKGYNMHHIWYSEEYNPESFVIITNEEHMAIHGQFISPSEGYDRHVSDKIYRDSHKEALSESKKKCYYEKWEQYNERNRQYYLEHREETLAYHDKYREEHREHYKALDDFYKAVRLHNNLTCKEWKALPKIERKAMIDAYRSDNNLK